MIEIVSRELVMFLHHFVILFSVSLSVLIYFDSL